MTSIMFIIFIAAYLTAPTSPITWAAFAILVAALLHESASIARKARRL